MKIALQSYTDTIDNRKHKSKHSKKVLNNTIPYGSVYWLVLLCVFMGYMGKIMLVKSLLGYLAFNTIIFFFNYILIDTIR